MWVKLKILSLCFLGIALDLSAARGETDPFTSTSRMVEAQISKQPIGVCWIESDGTIVVDLRRNADGISISMPPLKYPPMDPHYDAVLKHLGPLQPGEVKPVMPWPD